MKRPFGPYSDNDFDIMSQFQFISPCSMCVGAAVMVSLLFLDSIRQHCSELYSPPPTCLEFKFLVCFPRHWLPSHIFWCCSNLIVRLKSEREEPVLEPLLQGATQVFSFHYIQSQLERGREREDSIHPRGAATKVEIGWHHRIGKLVSSVLLNHL